MNEFRALIHSLAHTRLCSATSSSHRSEGAWCVIFLLMFIMLYAFALPHGCVRLVCVCVCVKCVPGYNAVFLLCLGSIKNTTISLAQHSTYIFLSIYSASDMISLFRRSFEPPSPNIFTNNTSQRRLLFAGSFRFIQIGIGPMYANKLREKITPFYTIALTKYSFSCIYSSAPSSFSRSTLFFHLPMSPTPPLISLRGSSFCFVSSCQFFCFDARLIYTKLYYFHSLRAPFRFPVLRLHKKWLRTSEWVICIRTKMRERMNIFEFRTFMTMARVKGENILFYTSNEYVSYSFRSQRCSPAIRSHQATLH